MHATTSGLYAALFLFPSMAAAQHVPSPYELNQRPQTTPQGQMTTYCSSYVTGVTELISLENTSRSPNPDELMRFAVNYGSSSVSDLYALVSADEAPNLVDQI
jgi:hypothetical protein